jgi:hypothetical protein
MFNWTTTTLVNELPHMVTEKDGKALRIGKHLFEKRWVEAIRKAEGHAMELCETWLDLNSIDFKGATVARLYIYVGLDGSEESIYANDWYRKGMPLSISFPVTDDAEDMVNSIVDLAKRFNVFTKVKKVLDVTAGTGKENEAPKTTLVIKGTHEHQRIQKIAILVNDPSEKNTTGDELAVVNYELNHTPDDKVTLKNAGKNGFGTYSQLLKDLRLPTAVHNNWLSVQKDEMPVVGAIYDQYIITYYAPSMANPSFTAVGNRSMSETTHVFWVKHELATAWENLLKTIDPEGDESGLNTTAGKTTGVYSNKKKSLVERVEALEPKND